MTPFEGDEWTAIFGQDDLLPMITEAAVAKALEGFPLPLQPGKDMAWLAMAVRRSLARCVRMPSFGSERSSNADVRAELKRLAELTASTCLELSDWDDGVALRLMDFACHRRDGEGGSEKASGIFIGDPPDIRRLRAVVLGMAWLSDFLDQAATATENQSGPWRQSVLRQSRIARGRCLAPIFEAAFGQNVTANNGRSDARHESTAFMDFYQRMANLAFGERATSNLAEVVKTACRLHRKRPVQFAHRIIPGLLQG